MRVVHAREAWFVSPSLSRLTQVSSHTAKKIEQGHGFVEKLLHRAYLLPLLYSLLRKSVPPPCRFPTFGLTVWENN
jgi:hypothetical protein